MKVLCVVPVNVIHETEMFIGLKKLGVDIQVITCRESEPCLTKLQTANIPVNIIPLKKKHDAAGIKRIQEVLDTHPFDIVHAFNNKTVYHALAACRRHPRKDSIKFIAYRGIVGNVSFLSPYSWATYLNPRVDRIICVAEAIRQFLLNMRFLWLKFPAHKAVTIYKGHKLDWYQSQPANLSEFGIPENAFVVGCTANYRPRKGIRYLIEAWELLADQDDIHLLLIGDMQNQKLLQQIKQSRNSANIHLSGFQDNAPGILAACDACILASIKREGLPKSVIEGMVYSTPPIVTNSGGSPELIEDGISGIIIPPKSPQAIAEAILKLQQNPELRSTMGQAARARIKRDFNAETTVEKTYALYNELYQELCQTSHS